MLIGKKLCPLLLSIPTARKLQPKWEDGWSVVSVKPPVTVKISDGRRSKVIHSNRLQYQFQAMADSSESTVTEDVLPLWMPPQI